jgi:hypothetical protein
MHDKWLYMRIVEATLPAASFQYFLPTGSRATPGNSSRMYSTNMDVEEERFPPGTKAPSVADKNVSGTRTAQGICRCN